MMAEWFAEIKTQRYHLQLVITTQQKEGWYMSTNIEITRATIYLEDGTKIVRNEPILVKSRKDYVAELKEEFENFKRVILIYNKF